MKPLHSLLVRLCTATILGLCVLLSAHSAAERLAKQADVDKLQDQVHALDKDVGVFSAKLDAQDKRIQDIQSITASQANHIGMVANQTTTLGNYISITSVVITLITFLAGFITYFSATSKAIEEAKKAAKFEVEEWFENHSKELQNEIAKLRQETSQAIAKIHEHEAGVGNKARDAEKHIEDMTPKVFNKSKTSELPQEDRAVLDTTNEALKQKPEAEFTAEDYYARGLAEYANERFESALTAFEQAFEYLSEEEPATKRVTYLLAKGTALGACNRSDEAIIVYDLIDQRYGADTATSMRKQVATALFNKGFALGTLNRTNDAIAVYGLIDQRYNADAATPIREKVASALFNKGVTLGTLNRPDEAIAVYNLIDQRYSADAATLIREKVASALFNKSVTLGTLNRPDEEIAVYDLIDQRYSADTTIREQVASALFNKGATLATLNRPDEAIAVYNLIDQRYGTDTATTIREKVANALVNKGFTLGTLNRPDEEIAVYDLIDQRYSTETATSMREQVASALFNKGVTLRTLKRPDEAIGVYNLIDQRYGTDTATTIREKVANALVNKGVTLGTLNRPDEAIAVYNLIDQRYSADTATTIREKVTNALVNKGFTLGTLNRPDEEIAVYDLIDQRYSADTSTSIREIVANALNAKGFHWLMKAKEHWTSVESRTHQLGQALVCLERALAQCKDEDKAVVHGNMGYAQFLQGTARKAEAHTRECLLLGRENMLQAQRADAQQHRVEPEDTQYEALLERLWHELDNGNPSEAAT